MDIQAEEPIAYVDTVIFCVNFLTAGVDYEWPMELNEPANKLVESVPGVENRDMEFCMGQHYGGTPYFRIAIDKEEYDAQGHERYMAYFENLVRSLEAMAQLYNSAKSKSGDGSDWNDWWGPL